MALMPEWMAQFNTVSHVVLIVMVGFMIYRLGRQEDRIDKIERDVGYTKGLRNGAQK